MKLDFYIILVSLCIYKAMTSTRLNKYRTTFADSHTNMLKRDIANLYHLCYLNTIQYHEDDDAHILADKFLYLFHAASRLHSEIGLKEKKIVTTLLHNPNGFWEEQSRFLHAHFARSDGLNQLREADSYLYDLLEWLLGTSMIRELEPANLHDMMDSSLQTIMRTFTSSKNVILDTSNDLSEARLKAIVAICRTESFIRRMITLNASGDYREHYDIKYLETFDNKITRSKAAIANKSDAAMLKYLMAHGHYEPFLPYYLQHA